MDDLKFNLSLISDDGLNYLIAENNKKIEELTNANKVFEKELENRKKANE